MPSPPEFRYISRKIRAFEVVHDFYPQQCGTALCNRRITVKIAIDFKSKCQNAEY